MSAAAWTCPIRWRCLYAIIEGVRYEVDPSPDDTAISLLFRAWCAGCGVEFTHPFRISAARERAA
ncbi:hypothetical protein MCAG_04978 [Micromonospora sp. ATCC 39149]|uniref:Uncharacterized protein n=1 Tax=Micromonospora carbonacea TaxID=47853 RepID=A0A7D6CD47_9ACTN|nr:hypothetical protein [Micromonospora sp. ATCC 39149]EEP74651.1 hypothetical protein MCAG_04978 [Micromonospora sp. ATCC 39149]QLK00466.1 hypothetical protein HZU44_10710 [Micromonospora carbonacea]